MTPPKAIISDSPDTASTALPSFASCGSILRSLLTTNGSITILLEAFFDEDQRADKVSERQVVLTQNYPDLGLTSGDPALEREIFLRGATTNRAYLHATTLVALNNVKPDFRESLITTGIPIGKLWDDYRMEIFKEVIRYDTRPADDLAAGFGVDPNDKLLTRSYRVFSDQRCIMLITESFPENLA